MHLDKDHRTADAPGQGSSYSRCTNPNPNPNPIMSQWAHPPYNARQPCVATVRRAVSQSALFVVIVLTMFIIIVLLMFIIIVLTMFIIIVEETCSINLLGAGPIVPMGHEQRGGRTLRTPGRLDYRTSIGQVQDK